MNGGTLGVAGPTASNLMARLGTCYTVRPGKADKRPGISNHVRRCAVGSSSSFPGGGAGRLPRRELKNNRRGVHSSSRYGKVVGASRERIHLDVDKIDSQQFVNYFRSAAPFIEGHRGKTFVVTLPSEVVVNDRTFFGILEDILVLTGLGVRIVIVYGCTSILSAKLEERGLEPIFVGGYRVTDKQSMQVAMEVAGRIQLEIEAKLSRGPSVSVVRKHTRDNSEFRYAPPVEVVAGNYTTAKRRGVVNGVDFGYTGEVRFIQHTAILKQLDAGHIVVMSNIGFSGIGEVLNCNMHVSQAHLPESSTCTSKGF